ncbi:MAG: efflux RND transporter periplasmic adaptor subunit, partial [Rhizonema sp. PD38]|nr:efflux RND transporter periplasmic adaptor subunit [Rhizonema sp. PD38]
MQDQITQDKITDESLRDQIHHESLTESHREFKENPPSEKNPPSSKRIGVVLVCVALLTGLGYVGIHTMSSKQPQKTSGRSGGRGRQMTPVVTVAKSFQKTVPVQLQPTFGHVEAESTVSVTPQVGGRITGVYFQKGQMVRKGQLLFTLDDRTQQAAIQQAKGTLAKDMAQVLQYRATLAKDLTVVRQAQANLLRDQAQAQFAQAQGKRYNSLLAQGAVSKDQAQQYSTNALATAATLQADKEAIANAQAATKVDQAQIKNGEGVVSSDQGALNNALVELSYTKIYAPINGRAGDILVTQGNVVTANSTNPLLSISQISPIQVSFSVPEANLPDIQKYSKNNKLTVEVTLPNNNAPPIQGVLAFVNNTIDNGTGTIKLMGNFNNTQGQLWPGQYVNTTLKLTTIPNATVVASQAVQNGPNGQFVFVLNPDDMKVT